MNDRTNDGERRNFQRLPFQTDAMLVKGKEKEQVELLDISLKGAFFRQPKKLDLGKGDRVRALIQLGKIGEDDPVIDLDAEVAHAGDKGIGATWREIDGESFTHLSRLLQLNFDDPDRLLKEFKTLAGDD